MKRGGSYTILPNAGCVVDIGLRNGKGKSPHFHSSQTIIADAPTSIYGDGGGGSSAAHPPIAPSRRRQILSDSAAAAAVSDNHNEMALLGGRCVADADCAAARGSVCGREHGRCECGRGTEFDIATQECRGEHEVYF